MLKVNHDRCRMFSWRSIFLVVMFLPFLIVIMVIMTASKWYKNRFSLELSVKVKTHTDKRTPCPFPDYSAALKIYKPFHLSKMPPRSPWNLQRLLGLQPLQETKPFKVSLLPANVTWRSKQLQWKKSWASFPRDRQGCNYRTAALRKTFI